MTYQVQRKTYNLTNTAAGVRNAIYAGTVIAQFGSCINTPVNMP